MFLQKARVAELDDTPICGRGKNRNDFLLQKIVVGVPSGFDSVVWDRLAINRTKVVRGWRGDERLLRWDLRDISGLL